MNKLERLIFISAVLAEAGIGLPYNEYGLTEEEFDTVGKMIEDYAEGISLKGLEKEGLSLIKELARSSRYSH